MRPLGLEHRESPSLLRFDVCKRNNRVQLKVRAAYSRPKHDAFFCDMDVSRLSAFPSSGNLSVALRFQPLPQPFEWSNFGVDLILGLFSPGSTPAPGKRHYAMSGMARTNFFSLTRNTALTVCALQITINSEGLTGNDLAAVREKARL